jgi:Ca-activated chloride channel family protein
MKARIFAMMPCPVISQNRLISADSTTLPLKALALRCETAGGLSRVVLEQAFANSSAQPLHVVYKLPLPADAAVSGFKFRIGERIIVGEVDRKAAAREKFEAAILSGQTAALLEEERSSLFTQELGNVPPGAEVTVEITIDQKLKWLAEGMWEWRFPLAAAPRYLGASNRVPDAKGISLAMTEVSDVRASLAMHVRDAVTGGRSPESPSHPLSCVADGDGFRVELGSGNAVSPDRDVVVRWSVSTAKIGILCDVAGPRAAVNDAHALLTIVPPQISAQQKHLARDLTFLLDTSGSMGGEPIAQAKKIVLAMLAGLEPDDRFELIEFSNAPRRFRNHLSAATREEKAAASAWVSSLSASGGTEMREGILEALRPSPGRARQAARAHVVLITDGLIGFEQEIIASILALLPGGARLHTVGVGSSVNRSLTAPAARAGRGVEVVLGLGEDPDRAAHRLRAHSEAPLVVDVEASGDALVATVPIKIPDLFAGAPLLLSARVLASGGEIILKGKTADGVWIQKIGVPRSEANSGSDAVVALFGRELVEDAEMKIAAGLDKRLLDASIEATGIAYKISTRLTSWVAIDPNASVDPRDPSRRVVQPQMLPYGVTAEGVGLRGAQHPIPTAAPMAFGAPHATVMRSRSAPGAGGAPPMARRPAAAPQAPQRQKREERTLVSRIKDAFKSEHAPEEADLSLDRSATVPVERRALKGRIVLKKSGEVVVEFVLDAALEWNMSRVSIFFEDGGSTPAAVDESKTTRNGSFYAGSVIRVALGFSPTLDASTIAKLEVDLADGPLVIEIES